MRYEVKIIPSARKQLAGLPLRLRRRIDKRVAGLAADPRPRGCKKLVGYADRYRIRVGDYRILYEIRDEVLLVLVIKVGPRGDVYR